jgi:hypothetical protein
MVFGSDFPYKLDHVFPRKLNTMTSSSPACSQKNSIFKNMKSNTANVMQILQMIHPNMVHQKIIGVTYETPPILVSHLQDHHRSH